MKKYVVYERKTTKTNTLFVKGEGGGSDFGGKIRVEIKIILLCLKIKKKYRSN